MRNARGQEIAQAIVASISDPVLLFGLRAATTTGAHLSLHLARSLEESIPTLRLPTTSLSQHRVTLSGLCTNPADQVITMVVRSSQSTTGRSNFDLRDVDGCNSKDITIDLTCGLPQASLRRRGIRR